MKEEKLLEYAEYDIRQFAIFCSNLIRYWGDVKRFEIKNPGNRDAVFIKELVYVIKGASIPIEVFARHGEINPGYAIEKLSIAKSYIDSAINYFNHKIKREEENGKIRKKN